MSVTAMEGPSHLAGGLEEAVVDLEIASKISTKSRAIKTSSLVDQVCSKAYRDGLPNALLSTLTDLVTLPNELDQGSRGNLIKNLYPTSKIKDSIAIKVVASLGHGRAKPSFPTQAALLKWLVMIYDVLENPTVMSRLYGVLFNLLDTIAIRSQLCHVLSLITRRKHVRPYRIQVLMELTRQAGNDPPLVGLMRVYKDYYPDVIVGDIISGRASVFMHPNVEWQQRLREIQALHIQRPEDGFHRGQDAFRVIRRATNGQRINTLSVIPQVHTSHAHESSTTLEEIENVSNFIRRLEKIELPNQLVAALEDPLLQKFFHLRGSYVVLKRLDNWLVSFFEDQLQVPHHSQNTILSMLRSIRGYTQSTKKLPPACLKYIQHMLVTWNGVTGREIVIDLLVYTPIGQFQELYSTIFQPLEDCILEDQSIESKLSLLTFYRNLLQQWSIILLSRTQNTPDVQPLTQLICHTNVLALTILQTSTNVKTCSCVLDFYESVASLFTLPTLRTAVRITTPTAELIYTLYFTSSLSTLGRLCSILALYKRAFESAMAPKVTNVSAGEQLSYPKEYVNHFNGFLMDICNCIWRSRAFNTSDLNALGCLLPTTIANSLTKYISNLDASISLATLFSLSMYPLFDLLAISYVRELEDKEEAIELRHAGPVTQASLKQLEKDGGLKLSWADYRLGVLRYLENKGVAGVGELMYNTMKHLMTARENMAQRRGST